MYILIAISIWCCYVVQSQPTNINATAVTYLGESLVGVYTSPSSILVAGTGQIQTNGFVAKLDTTGQKLLGSVAIPGTTLVIARGATVNKVPCLAVATDTGFVIVTEDLKIQQTVTVTGGVDKLEIGSDGVVATWTGKLVQTWGIDGSHLGSFNVSYTSIGTGAVDSARKSIVLIGDYNRVHNNVPVRVIALYAYTYDFSKLLWTDYDYPGTAMGNDMADTAGKRAAIGADGGLYFIGGPMGGNNLFRWGAKALNSPVNDVSIDSYNQQYNTASAVTVYMARLDPTSGNVQAGQYVLARLPNTKGNSFSGIDITADESGTISLLAGSACCIEHRDNITVSGMPTGPYSGGEVSIYVVSPDLKTRKSWVVFTKAGSNGPGIGISSSSGVGAMVANIKTGSEIITINPIHKTFNTPTAGFLAVWTL